MRYALAFGLVLVSLIFPSAALAQSQIQMKIQPILFEEKVEPGSELVKSLTISNLSDAEQTLFPVARDIVGIGADNRPIYADETEDRGRMALSSWISFEQTSLSVRPDSSATLRFTIKVPKDASPGSHFAGVFFSYRPEGELRNATGVGYDIGSIVNLQIAGDVNVKAGVREFMTSKVVYGEPNVQFSARVENTGNVFIRPRGLIEIKGMFGKRFEPLIVNDIGMGVLPNTERTYQVDWRPDGFQMGHYRATLALSYGEANAQQTLTSGVDFWIIPVGTLLPVFGVLLVIAVVFYIILRMYIRSQVARLGGGRAASVERENARGLSRLAAVVIAVLVSIIVGLLILFFYFG